MNLEAFLDDTPGETRGIVARDGRYEHLIIQREVDLPAHRLGARSVGRVSQIDHGFGAAFVDIGVQGRAAFLPLVVGVKLREGDHVEVVTTTEPRTDKGAVVRLVGPAEGPPRLLAQGPDVRAELARLAPGVDIRTGVDAIRAGLEAEEEALGRGGVFPEAGLDLAVERTRALVAVDIDHSGAPGRDARQARHRANVEGMRQAARLIRLKNWGGLVAIDLIGTRLDAEAIVQVARAAFPGDPDTVFGPLNRFGVLQLSLPWRRAPIEERLRGPTHAAIGVARALRLRLLEDTATPRVCAYCEPTEAALVTPLAARLGPRASVVADPTVRPGHADIREV